MAAKPAKTMLWDLSPEELFHLFNSSESGLSDEDAEKKLAKHIKNNKLLANKITGLVESYVECFFKENFAKIYSELRAFRKQLKNRTFLEGLCFSFQELLYDNVGYLIKNK